MPERCSNPTCEQHWPAPKPFLKPALDAALPDFEKALLAAAERALADLRAVDEWHYGQRRTAPDA